ncbi:MAG: TrkA C-terminal domain-containing protein [Bacteroidota bacterium]
MIQIFIENPILLLFVVASLGYLLGTVKIKGGSLGVAAILFTGLAFGAINPQLQIPETILLLGLSIYVYSVGLSSGPAFFNSYQKNGIRDFGFAILTLGFSGLVAVLLWLVFGFTAASIAGVYTGSTTNTAALAGVIDLISTTRAGADNAGLIESTVVGYSFAYPMGVMGGIIAIVLLERWLRIDYQEEKERLRKEYPSDENLTSATVEVNSARFAEGVSLRDLFKEFDWNVVFGRVLQNDEVSLSHWDTVLRSGDKIVVVGNQSEINNVAAALGQFSKADITASKSQFKTKRIFVSNPDLAGRTIASLNLKEKYHAIFTRLRRGDMVMLAKSDTVLEIGDRIRFIAREEDLAELSELFGDSYQASSKINLFSFGLGIGLGMILGTIEFSLGANFNLKLGYAGGPLIVGLILGALRRTGPVVWTLPYSANVTLQQIGLILLLSAIGVRSGNAFVQSFTAEGACIFIASAIISLLTAFAIILLGYKWLKLPFSLLTGMVANQPAILDFAIARAKNNIPMYGYSLMFPIGLILKILIAQLLFLVLS